MKIRGRVIILDEDDVIDDTFAKLSNMKYCPNNESLKTVDVRGTLQISRMILDVTFECVL
jgi:hypothetical protein